MAQSTTVTVRMSEDLKSDLGKLAARTQRTQSFLAEQAIAGFVARELEMIAAIDEGFEDYANGDVVSHEEVKARLRATVAKYEPKG